MKHLTTIVFLLFVAIGPRAINAQSINSWVEVALSEEFFGVSMPRQPEQQNQQANYGKLTVNGKRYVASDGGVTFTIWSFVNTKYRSAPPTDSYLDVCADLVWESLLRPDRDKLPRDGRIRTGITYVKELPTQPAAGREYSIVLGDMSGTARFFVVDARIYILLALNSPGSVWETEKFFQSFTIKPVTAAPDKDQIRMGDPIIRGRNESTEDDQVFGARETTERARILSKAEAIYTESARKYGVQGTVVLRAVLSKEGQVTSIYIVKKLPHGLTEAAIAAARGIKFVPAVKDGRSASQYIQLEYNFNLY